MSSAPHSTNSASGLTACRACRSGIVPPEPTSIGGRPKASRRAVRAARPTGPSVAHRNGRAAFTRSTSTRPPTARAPPDGAPAPRAPRRARCPARCASTAWPGRCRPARSTNDRSASRRCPIALMLGRHQSRWPIVPLPISRGSVDDVGHRTGSRLPARRRRRDRRRAGPRPPRSPRRRARLASSRDIAIRASGAGPPKTPECNAWVRVVTVTMHETSPRRVVVSAGDPTSRLPMSATTNASASNIDGFACTNDSRFEVVSSMPSTISRTVQGGRPPSARTVARWIAMPLLSSAAPSARDPAVRSRHGRPGVRGPPLLRRGGLHVVVGIEHDRR